jgi:RNA polymerase sigma-70 factor (ECF subfamily)
MGDEEKLVRDVLAGSEEAFHQLVRLHQAHVRAYLTRYVRDAQVVLDLAQETFWRAYQNLHTWRSDAPFRMWLFAIARQRALTHLRDDARRRTHEGRSLDSVAAAWAARPLEDDPAGFARHEKELRALEECIRNLAPASAGILSEYYFKGRSALEIAKTTGKRDTAVWMALSRIRQALRRCIDARLLSLGTPS